MQSLKHVVNVFEILPQDPINLIFKYLTSEEVIQAKRVCQLWKNIAANNFYECFKNEITANFPEKLIESFGGVEKIVKLPQIRLFSPDSDSLQEILKGEKGSILLVRDPVFDMQGKLLKILLHFRLALKGEYKNKEKDKCLLDIYFREGKVKIVYTPDDNVPHFKNFFWGDDINGKIQDTNYNLLKKVITQKIVVGYDGEVHFSGNISLDEEYMQKNEKESK